MTALNYLAAHAALATLWTEGAVSLPEFYNQATDIHFAFPAFAAAVESAWESLNLSSFEGE